MPRKTIWLVVAVGLLTTDCTHKAVDPRPISRQELDQESSCGFTMAPGEEFYYDLQTRYPVLRSDVIITIQPDTANGPVSPEGLFDKHPCLLRDSGAEYLDRGFYFYRLAPGWTFSSADLDLRADPAINRVLPIYGSSRYRESFWVTDLIDVQFEDSVTRDEAERILADFNLHYVDENPYRNLLWEVRLDDTYKGSPLACGNALHVTEGVRWACATQYVRIVPALARLSIGPFTKRVGDLPPGSECTWSWRHQFRRVRIRWERRACTHEAFFIPACVRIRHNCLRGHFVGGSWPGIPVDGPCSGLVVSPEG